jgi:hypothetical protein
MDDAGRASPREVFAFRGETFERGPVAWHQAAGLRSLASAAETGASAGDVIAYVRGVARVLRRATRPRWSPLRPRTWWRRVTWALRPNPFLAADLAEAGVLAEIAARGAAAVRVGQRTRC